MKPKQDGRRNLFHRMRKNGKHESQDTEVEGCMGKRHSDLHTILDACGYDVENIITTSDVNVAGDCISQIDDEDLPLPILQQCRLHKDRRDKALMGLADAVNALDELGSAHSTTLRRSENSVENLAGPGSVEELVALRAAVHNLSNAFKYATPFQKSNSLSHFTTDGIYSMKEQVKRIRRKPVPIHYGVTSKDSVQDDIRNDPRSFVNPIQSEERSVDETLEYSTAPYLRRISISKPLFSLDVDHAVVQETKSLKEILSLPMDNKKVNKIATTSQSDDMEGQSTYIRSSTMYAGRSMGLPRLELDLPDNSSRFSQDYSRQNYSSESDSAGRSSRAYSISSFDSIISDEGHSSTDPSSISSVTSSPARKSIHLLNSSNSLGLTEMHPKQEPVDRSTAPRRPNRYPNRYSSLIQTKRQTVQLDSCSPDDELQTYIIDHDQYVSSNDETPRPGALGFPI